MLINRLLFCFIIFTISLFSQGREFSLQDVRENMQEIFAYHVENRELTPLVVRRTFKIYMEQFDPAKIYLLKEESRAFLELSDTEVSAIIRRYYQDDFSDFIRLNQIIERASERAQRFRSELQETIIETNQKAKSHKKFTDFAATERELRERIFIEQVALVEHEKREQPQLELTRENKQKIFKLWERKKRDFEATYLSNQDHYLAMHILKAMTRSLDAHSSFYSPDEAFEIRTLLKKQMEGIGIVLREGIDGTYISELITGGPAARSGLIKRGDFLVAIDGKDLATAPFNQIAESMRGPAGSSITLTLKRNDQISEVKLHREKIIMDEDRLTYTYEPYGDGIIGKINLPAFYDNGEGVTAEQDLKKAIRALKAKGKLLGLVIDLRENTGGFLTQAVNIASLFIPKGIIVISKYADGEIRYARDIDGRIFFDGPVVLLTSKVSASASEIVAQALQDYGVTVIVGDSRTYGKGSMQYQTLTDERAKAFFKVTVGRYYTASGRSTQIEGVKADIHVPTKYAPYNIGERYLEYPLSSDAIEFHLFENLKEVDVATYKTFKEDFLPLLPSKETEWQKMLPALKANSENRLQKNKDFQLFLGDKKNYGKDDLQMKESVNIVKDMIILKQ